MAMLFRLMLATTVLLFLPMLQTQAQDASAQAAATPLDLIELLGEIDGEDTESLDAAISQVELNTSNAKTSGAKTDEVKSGQAKAYPQEVKK